MQAPQQELRASLDRLIRGTPSAASKHLPGCLDAHGMVRHGMKKHACLHRFTGEPF